MSNVTTIKQAMAKKFNLPVEDFVDFKMGNKTVVMYGAVNPIYRGSWDKIMEAPVKDYMVKVDNKQFDTREAMTFKVYQAFQKQYSNNPKPDSIDLDLWSSTWLTGDKSDRHLAPMADLHEGQANQDRDYRSGDFRFIGFRPVVVIENLASEVSPSLATFSSSDLQVNTDALNRLSDILEKVFQT